MDMMDPMAGMMDDPMAQGQDPMMGQDMGMEQPQPEQPMAPPEGDIGGMPVEEVIQNINLARKLKNKKLENGTPVLDEMAKIVLDGIKLDEQSRAEWLEEMKEGFKLSLLLREQKSWPWMNASNIKYPLIATAAMQFSARAYPALVPPDGSIVKARAIPTTINAMFLDSATRIARHMSWQLMVKNTEWEKEMDKLLMTLSVSGSMFKKTYFDYVDNKNCSYIIYPEDFIVDYYATSVEGAYRKTEVLRMNKNKIVEYINNDEEFLDIEYGEPSVYEYDVERLDTGDGAPSLNNGTPHVFYQCHTYWDLDDDGYEEPVVVTIHKDTEKVVRVTARFTSDGIESNEKGDIIRIKPLEYYTAFTFIENPIGSLYGIGFGMLLGPINEAINTIINQLVDAGTLNNLQSGYISKTLRMNMSAQGFAPGEWKVCQASGEEMKNGIVPLPTKEPSAVLMQLVQMLIQSGMQLASVAEIFVGKMPGQNTPATTTQQTVEQSMAVFTAVYKRVYRSLGEEFSKLMYLNRINPQLVLEEADESGLDIKPQDYNLPVHSIIPGADPAGDSQVVKQQKFAFVSQMLLPLGTINPMALTQWALEFMEIPNYQQLMMQPQPPPPDPKIETEKMKQQTMQQKAQLDAQAQQADMEGKTADREQEAAYKEKLAAIEYARAQQEMQQKAQEAVLDRYDRVQQMRIDQVDRVNQARANSRDREMKSQANREQYFMKSAQSRATHEQKMKQSSEAAAAKQKQQKASAKPPKSKK